MSLPYGLLGLLTYQDSTGYDLAKLFEDSLNNFWHAQSSQIYRELDRMEQKGWVSSKNVIQDKRPNKRLYSITHDGRAALLSWLNNASVDFENPHEPLLVRIFFGADAPEVTLALLKTCRDMCLSVMETYPNSINANIEHYVKSVPDGENKRAYWEMTLDYGTSQCKMTAEWAQRCIDRLEKEVEQ